MFQGKKIIALIPLRGGSKSIPYKNIKEIAGHPLAFWVLKAAKESKYIDEVYVSTEDEKIKTTIKSLNLGVIITDRPAELAADTSSTISVVMDFVSKVKNFDLFMLMQATSPMTTSEYVDKAIEQFFEDGCDSLLSGIKEKKFIWTKEGECLNRDPLKDRPRRQDASFPNIYSENGALYISKKEILEKYHHRLAGKIGVYEMPEDAAIDINEPADWAEAEKLLLDREVNKK